ncbi:MAG: Nramp family divalent metal transporter [Pseudomonadales bacterium]
MASRLRCIELWLVLERGILNTEAICVAAEAAGPADVKSRSAHITETTAFRDEYTHPHGAEIPAPRAWSGRLRHLGPGLIVSASIVGSGEIILTASLGAAVGFGMLWWVLMSCWSKSIVQAELTRYIVVSGDTYIRALNRIPGRLPGPKGPVAWPVVVGLLAFIPGLTGLGGLMGGAALAIVLVFPELSSLQVVAGLALLIALLLSTGRYRRLEQVLIPMVFIFTLTTLICLGLMQSTERAVTASDLLSGLQFDFDPTFAVLALAVYGYTGVNSAEISAYTYWCVEKGYPARVGPISASSDYVARAQGWLKVLQLDVGLTLLLITLATLPFYCLGAGILHPLGQVPSGTETISVLSQMFTETIGPGAFWLFALGAFCILFSSSVSGVAAGARYIPDYLMELGFLDRERIDIRKKIIRVYGLLVPFVGFIFYLGFQQPVLMVTIAACFGAMMLPLQCGMAIYLGEKTLPSPLKPGVLAKWFLRVTFLFQVVMAGMVLYFVVF